MPRNVNPDTIGFLAGDISRMIRAEFDRLMARSGIGITGAEARVLANAARAGEVRQNVLAEILGVEAMTLTGVLDRLESGRPRVPQDRSRPTAAPSWSRSPPKPIPCLRASRRSRSAVRAAASAGLAPEDWARLIGMLKLVRTNLAEQRSQAARESDAA